jgi:hypothetical protein
MADPAVADLTYARERAVDLLDFKPHKILGLCDRDDVRDRLDDIEQVRDALTTYAEALAADLNDNLPLTARVDLNEFRASLADAFADLRGAFARAADEIEEAA